MISPIFGGAFIYAKQMINFFTQFVLFCRRVEIPRFSLQIIIHRNFTLLLLNSMSFRASILCFITVLSISLLLFYSKNKFSESSLYIAQLSPTIITIAAMGIFAQKFVFMNRQILVSYIVICTNIIGIIAVFTAAKVFGSAGVIIGEIFAHILQIGIFLKLDEETQGAKYGD